MDEFFIVLPFLIVLIYYMETDPNEPGIIYWLLNGKSEDI